MSPHPLTNFEIQIYYQNEPKFNEYESIGTYQIAFYANTKNVTYFDSFGVEHVPKKIRKFIRNKNIITNIHRTQAYYSIMCECFCIRFIDFMLKR